MTQERSIPGWLKQALELGPVLAFFVAFFLLKEETYPFFGLTLDRFVFITALFVPLMILCMGIQWALSRHLSRMQTITLILVVVFGALTVAFNDPLFLKLKPTILYLTFAGLLYLGLYRGRSYLAYVMEGLMPLKQEGWMILTRRTAHMFLGLAVANAAVAYLMSDAIWVTFKTFGLTVLLFAFFISQYKLVERYAELPEESTGDDSPGA